MTLDHDTLVAFSKSFGLFYLIALSIGVLIYAYRHATVSSLTPFLYVQLGFSTFAGWLVFGHAPGLLALLGIVLIAVAGAACTWLMARRVPGKR